MASAADQENYGDGLMVLLRNGILALFVHGEKEHLL